MQCITGWRNRQWGEIAHTVAVLGLIILAIEGVRLESLVGWVACPPRWVRIGGAQQRARHVGNGISWSVTLTVHPDKRSADFTILWSGEVMTHHSVTCPPLGWHCVTAESIVQQIRKLATVLPDHQIAKRLNDEGIHTQTGKTWTYERVRSIRKQHSIPTSCPIDPTQPTPRGDGLISAQTAAQLLRVSPSTIRLWATQGVLLSDQRVSGSKLWVRVNDGDLTRLNGSLQCSHLLTITDLITEHQITRNEVWALVRAGHYLPYRVRNGRNWEWRLEKNS